MLSQALWKHCTKKLRFYCKPTTRQTLRSKWQILQCKLNKIDITVAEWHPWHKRNLENAWIFHHNRVLLQELKPHLNLIHYNSDELPKTKKKAPQVMKSTQTQSKLKSLYSDMYKMENRKWHHQSLSYLQTWVLTTFTAQGIIIPMPAICWCEVQTVLIFTQEPCCSCKNNYYWQPEKGLILVLHAAARHFANSNQLRRRVTTHTQKA